MRQRGRDEQRAELTSSLPVSSRAACLFINFFIQSYRRKGVAAAAKKAAKEQKTVKVQ